MMKMKMMKVFVVLVVCRQWKGFSEVVSRESHHRAELVFRVNTASVTPALALPPALSPPSIPSNLVAVFQNEKLNTMRPCVCVTRSHCIRYGSAEWPHRGETQTGRQGDRFTSGVD